MKKVLLLFLACAISFQMIGCSSLKEEKEAKAKEKETVEETEPEENTVNDTQNSLPGKDDPSVNETKPTSTKPVMTKPTEPEQTEMVLDPNNYYNNPEPEYYEENAIVLNPIYVYWGEDGCLYAECEIINTYDAAVTDIDLYYFCISNDDGIIAEGDFGVLEGLTLEAGYYDTWELWFEPSAVVAFGADLTSMEYYYEYEAAYA